MASSSRKTSILLACGVAVAFLVWMASGILTDRDGNRNAAASAGGDAVAAGERAMRVTVVRSVARAVPGEIDLSARTEPNRSVEIRAETDGRVISLGADRGARIQSGALIARLDMRDRAAQLAEAEAVIEQTRLQYEAALELRGQQFVSETQIAETMARLAGARATRERIALDIERTEIVAPFDGLLQERTVEIGDYVQSGDTLAEVVDSDPVIIVADVNERYAGSLTVGGPGSAEIDGSLMTGTVRYLAPVANDATRTFRLELAVPNPGGRIRAGMSARLVLDTGEINAHSLSPSLLTLSDDGAIGVKTVDDFDRVRFYEVTLEGSEDDHVTVSGLPDVVRIISVGQGFVVDGQEVAPVEGDAELSQSDDERTY